MEASDTTSDDKAISKAGRKDVANRTEEGEEKEEEVGMQVREGKSTLNTISRKKGCKERSLRNEEIASASSSNDASFMNRSGK